MVMMGSPAVDNVSPFTIPETPRTVASSGYSTPKKYKSPNAEMKDLTQKLHETSMRSPQDAKNNNKKKLLSPSHQMTLEHAQHRSVV